MFLIISQSRFLPNTLIKIHIIWQHTLDGNCLYHKLFRVHNYSGHLSICLDLWKKSSIRSFILYPSKLLIIWHTFSNDFLNDYHYNFIYCYPWFSCLSVCTPASTDGLHSNWHAAVIIKLKTFKQLDSCISVNLTFLCTF